VFAARGRSSSHEFHDNRSGGGSSSSRQARDRYRFEPHPRHVNDHRYQYDDRRHDNGYHDSAASSGIPPSQTETWPPLFETDGAAYVFDARSGLFYEGLSDFFFDPKTKLYFGNKQQLYYMHCPGQQPAFVAVPNSNNSPNAASTLTEPSQDTPPPTGNEQVKDTSATDTNVGAPPPKNKIAISIGMKASGKAASQEVKNDANTATLEAHGEAAPAIVAKPTMEIFPIQKKNCTADIEKWAKRAEEIRVQPEAKGGTKQHVDDPSLNLTDNQVADKVCTTAGGRPICFLCKRKFSSLEKLREHEMVSQLHKQNLLKANNNAGISSAISQPKEYRDRAKERRALFGEENPKSKTYVVGHLDTSIVPEAKAPSPQENLGDSNIGNKLLQKLGWKEGASLGRTAGTAVDKESSVSGSLKQDWERIEAIASSENGGNHQSSKGIGRL